MKTFKIIDLCWQVLALVAGILLYMNPNSAFGNTFFIVYYLAGGAQVLSFFTHLFFLNHTWYNKKNRKFYGKVILATFLLGLFSWLLLDNAPLFTLIVWGGALFVTPFFAIWYFNIGLTELRTMRNKELVHLK
jgi:hypothetical protein